METDKDRTAMRRLCGRFIIPVLALTGLAALLSGCLTITEASLT